MFNGLLVAIGIVSKGTPLGSILEICASTTAAESAAFTSLLIDDHAASTGWKVANTGTIDPFTCLWGREPMRHDGRRYLHPRLVDDTNQITPRRREQYSRAKLVFAKLSSSIEVFFDEHGEFAALNANFAFAEGEAGLYYAGILNSAIASWLYRQLFGSLGMSGDYLQFQAPQLRALPVVPFDGREIAHNRLVALVRTAIAAPGDGAIRDQINVTVMSVFGLSPDTRL